jgi:hypothetical protein
VCADQTVLSHCVVCCSENGTFRVIGKIPVDIIKREGNSKGQSGVNNSETQETLGTKHRMQTNKTQKQ